MKKTLKILICNLFLLCLVAKCLADPFMANSSGEGLGQYGYLESDASTFVQCESGTFNNIEQYAARFWTGGEVVYYTSNDVGCGSPSASRQTGNYNNGDFTNWSPGDIASVSIYSKFCGSGWSHDSNSDGTPDGIGYNERDFMKIEVDNGYSGTLSSTIEDNTQNLVGTFTITAGSNTLTLDRLWIRNTGTAQETNDIPNGGVYIYYEAITGSETFNGNESWSQIFGNYNGNSISNNEYGSDDANIPVLSGGTRVYVVIQDLNDNATNGRTVDFRIINDGISFEQSMDGFNLLRVGETDITSNAPSILPVTFLDFTAQQKDGEALVSWKTSSELNNSHFLIQRSKDSKTWQNIDEVKGAGTTDEPQSYTFIDKSPLQGLNYYRLKQVDYDGAYDFSKVVSIDMQKDNVILVYPNPAQEEIWLELEEEQGAGSVLSIFNITGHLVKQIIFEERHKTLHVPLENFNDGVYLLQIKDKTGQLFARQVFVKG